MKPFFMLRVEKCVPAKTCSEYVIHLEVHYAPKRR